MSLQPGVWKLAPLGSVMLGGGATCFLIGLPGEPLAAFAWPGYLIALLGAILLFWVYLSRDQLRAG